GCASDCMAVLPACRVGCAGPTHLSDALRTCYGPRSADSAKRVAPTLVSCVCSSCSGSLGGAGQRLLVIVRGCVCLDGQRWLGRHANRLRRSDAQATPWPLPSIGQSAAT